MLLSPVAPLDGMRPVQVAAFLPQLKDKSVMHKSTRIVAWCAALLFGGTSVAQAQMPAWTDKGFATFSIGLQAGSQEFTETATPVIYGESALITVPHSVDGGLLIDFSGGARVWRNFGVGLGYSRTSSSEAPTLAALIPNPAVFNSPRAASASTGELEHIESAIHLQLLWMLPITNEFEVAAIFGPSFYNITQDLVGNVGITEGSPPFGSVTISSVEVLRQSERGTGFTLGMDANYLLTPQYGIGGFLRYSGADADMETAGGGTVTVSAGGFQLGVGARVRF